MRQWARLLNTKLLDVFCRVLFSKLSRRTKSPVFMRRFFVLVVNPVNIKMCQSTSKELVSFLPSLSCISHLHLKCLFFWLRNLNITAKKSAFRGKKQNLTQCRLPLLFSGWRQSRLVILKHGSYWKQQLLFFHCGFLCNLSEFFLFILWRGDNFLQSSWLCCL